MLPILLIRDCIQVKILLYGCEVVRTVCTLGEGLAKTNPFAHFV